MNQLKEMTLNNGVRMDQWLAHLTDEHGTLKVRCPGSNPAVMYKYYIVLINFLSLPPQTKENGFKENGFNKENGDNGLKKKTLKAYYTKIN